MSGEPRYVVGSALRRLQDFEEQPAQFTATLEEAMAEADRDGTSTVEQVVAEMQSVIDAHKK
jgi:hypothetical protein